MSAPIRGVLHERTSQHQHTKTGGHEEALVQKEWMNLRCLFEIARKEKQQTWASRRTTTESNQGK